MKKFIITAAVCCLCACNTHRTEKVFSGTFDRDSVLEVCSAVRDWQLENFNQVAKTDSAYITEYQVHWSAGVLYSGMFDWADYTNDFKSFDFLEKIGKANDWNLFNHRAYHADDICVGRMYVLMAQRFGHPEWMQSTLERAHFVATHPSPEPLDFRNQRGKYRRWAWCDALFMAPPVYAELYRLTGEKCFLEYLENEFSTCTDSLFDKDEHLYYRDCVRMKNREPNGAKEFWARGNAWVFSGICMTLDALPKDYGKRTYFEDIFKQMAPSIVECQDINGSWHPSLLAPEHFPTAENSSSALFCYGLAWGIRHKLLDQETYLPVLQKGWKALCSYVQKDGKLGFVQPIGAFPKGGISAGDTQLYAVGGFLAAGCEILKMLDGYEVEPAEVTGTLKNKLTRNTDNDLTIGCEVLDRDYADYHKYKNWLDSLGCRRLRLQAGWAKTEKEKGVYDFSWLDSIVDDAVSRGLVPWIETSYGNPIYEGGGTKFLAGGWPTSEEALEAWDNWVREMARRYKGKVNEWEVWNEPDINVEQFKDPITYVNLAIRTARTIKSIDPDARIAAFALAYCKPDVFDTCLAEMQKQGALDLFDWVTYHFYRYRPEDIFAAADSLQAVLDRYETKMTLRQGETGAPSAGNYGGALSDYGWSETSQAKWDLRRMLGDKGRGTQTTVFTISDFTYSKDDHITKTNVKGLLATDAGHNITRPKQAYHAVRNLATLWDETDTPIPAYGISVSGTGSHSIYAFRDTETGLESIAVWNDSSIPGDSETASIGTVTVKGSFTIMNPVCIDIRTGEIRRVECERSVNELVLYGIPVYDSPVMIIDKSLVRIR